MLLALAALCSPLDLAYTIQTFEMFGLKAISAKGVAVGGLADCYRWDGQKLEKLPRKMLEVQAIDDQGDIVGSGYDDEAYILRNDALVQLTPLGDYRHAKAVAINSHGVAVGSSFSDGNSRAVFWDDDGPHDLGVLPDQKRSEAAGINDAGWIVGWSSGGSSKQPFLYKDGKMTALPVPETYTSGFARSINGDGVVVGACYAGKKVACRWVDGKSEVLGLLPSQYESEARAINSAGDIVGKSGPKVPWLGDGPIPKELFQSHVFLWRRGRMYDLTALVHKQNPRLFLYEANGINDAGQIVGEALQDPKIVEPQIYGKFLGFILTPKTK